MPKKKKSKIDIDPTGMTWQDVIKLDPTHVKNLSQRSLAKLTSRLVSAYNKRAKRLERSGLAEASPSYRGLQEAGKTRLSVKGKSYAELFSTYADAKRLLTERSTFSVAGTKKLMRDTSERIGHDFSSKEEARRFWEAIDKLKEKDIGNDKRTSTDIQREVADMMFNEDASIDDILDHYGVIMESQVPDFDEETGEIFGFGEENDEDEEEEFSIFDDDTPW